MESSAIKNKEHILKFYQTISGFSKSKEILAEFTDDAQLIKQFLYFESLIPCFFILIDEITAEGARVFVRVRFQGLQQGKINGNPPTYQHVEFPLAVGYTLNSGRIIDYWIISDGVSLIEQLGLTIDTNEDCA